MNTFKKLSIVIPVFNEARTLEAVLDAVTAVKLDLERELVIDWAKMPVPLQEHLGLDAATLKRTPAAGATVRLDFSRFTKKIEEPNGWYNVKVTMKEGSNELAFADKIMTSDFAENNTAVQNAERNRVQHRR